MGAPAALLLQQGLAADAAWRYRSVAREGTTIAMSRTIALGRIAMAACKAVRSAQMPAGKLAFSWLLPSAAPTWKLE
jgi:hypothetical protein